jgi:NADP-dependent 3-hydroxy acid dehydrogenase YdfG
MEKMSNRIKSLVKGYESKVLEADENIKLLLNNAGIIPEHTDINKDIDKWLEVKSSNFGKLQHIASYLPKQENKDGK